jgi:multiple sugar transport system substrate-binding protein
VPYVFSTPTLFYNADLFRNAGLDPDRPPTTWAEVKQYGLQIKQRTGKLGIDIGCLGTFDWCFQALVLSNGGRVLSEDRSPLTFGEPASVEAVAMWQDLVKSGIYPATWATIPLLAVYLLLQRQVVDAFVRSGLR